MDTQGATAASAPVAACTLDQYDLVGVIGKGSFGTVSRVRRKADGRIMVWKELNYGTLREKEKQLVVSEVRGTWGGARIEGGRGSCGVCVCVFWGGGGARARGRGGAPKQAPFR
jgi:hypothetical protein